MTDPFRIVIVASMCVLVWLLPAARAADVEPPVTALAFAPDGRSLVVGSSRGVEVRSWPGLATLRTLATRLRQVHDLAFSPGGDVLAVAGGSPGEAGEVEVFTWPAGRLTRHDSPHDDLVHAVAWRNDGAAFATASADGLVLVHPADGRDPPLSLEGHTNVVLAAGFVGRNLVTAGLDQGVRIWDVEAGRVLRSLNNHTAPVVGLAIRPAHAGSGLPMVATIGSDRTCRLWQPTIGRMVRLARLPSPPLAVAWVSRGTSTALAIACACADGHVRLIDPETVGALGDFPAIEGWAHSLAPAPGGGALAVGGENRQLVRLAVE
jgi:WD40 repeat protein